MTIFGECFSSMSDLLGYVIRHRLPDKWVTTMALLRSEAQFHTVSHFREKIAERTLREYNCIPWDLAISYIEYLREVYENWDELETLIDSSLEVLPYNIRQRDDVRLATYRFKEFIVVPVLSLDRLVRLWDMDTSALSTSSYSAIAEKFGVSKATVYNVIHKQPGCGDTLRHEIQTYIDSELKDKRSKRRKKAKNRIEMSLWRRLKLVKSCLEQKASDGEDVSTLEGIFNRLDSLSYSRRIKTKKE